MHEERDEYTDDYDFDDGTCPECGDGENYESYRSSCIDDMCHGGDVPCMHGSTARLKCGLCGK